MSVKATQLRMDIIMHFLCYNLQYVVPKCKRHAIVSKDCKRRWLLQVRRTFLLAASILSRGYFIGMQMMMLTQSFRFFFNYVRPRVLILIPGTITTYKGGMVQST